MESPRVILVSPAIPTVLGDQTRHVLPGQELWTNSFNNVHVYPAHLSAAVFEQALSKTLAAFPYAAGRLWRVEDEWEIRLTNESNVPVTIDTIVRSEQESRESFPFPSEFVIQPIELYNKFVSLNPEKPVLQGEGTEPLLTLKLTYWYTKEVDGITNKGGTALGVSWNHTLGDAHALYLFMTYLSGMYHGLQQTEGNLDIPPLSLERHFFPDPSAKSREVADRFIPKMPHLSRDYEGSQVNGMFQTMIETTEQVQLRIPGEVLDELFERAREGGAEEKLTVNDALTAYLITAVNRCLETPVQVVISAVNYRLPAKAQGSTTPYDHPRAMFNRLFMIFTEPLPVESRFSVPIYARAIRRSITEARNPEFVENWVTFAADFMKKSVNASRYPWFFANEGEWTANSHYRYNWNDAHFGFFDQARFFTALSFERYFRIFRSNPGGESAGLSRKGTWPADIGLRIRRGLKEQLIRVIKEDIPEAVFDDAV